MLVSNQMSVRAFDCIRCRCASCIGLNAIAMIIMIGSGWKIYNDEVLFGRLHFPDWITIGGEPAGRPAMALPRHVDPRDQWLDLSHLWSRDRAVSAACCFRSGCASSIADVNDALHFRLSARRPDGYNAVQRLLYVGIILVGIVQVLSGLAIWKPMQFSELTTLFYGFQGARLVHFLGMAAIVGFLVVHVALALLVPKTIATMLTGGPQSVDRRQQSPARGQRPSGHCRLMGGRRCPYARPSPSIFRPKRAHRPERARGKQEAR